MRRPLPHPLNKKRALASLHPNLKKTEKSSTSLQKQRKSSLVLPRQEDSFLQCSETDEGPSQNSRQAPATSRERTGLRLPRERRGLRLPLSRQETPPFSLGKRSNSAADYLLFLFRRWKRAYRSLLTSNNTSPLPHPRQEETESFLQSNVTEESSISK